MEQLKLRKGTPEDVPNLMAILRAAIGTMEAAGIHQWDEIYPDEATICGDIAWRDSM